MIQVTPVILCGGSGTRLWPLSRTGFPKQFLCLTGNESLFQQAAQRLSQLGNSDIAVANPIIVMGEDHRFLAAEQLREAGIEMGSALLEPVGRNTAPALTLAALAAMERDADPVLVVTPADQTVVNVAALTAAMQQAVAEAANGSIVILGVTPDKPETGYGYIQVAKSLQGKAEAIQLVQRFVEKPDVNTAQTYLNEGGYYWNAGMFVLKASVWLTRVCAEAAARNGVRNFVLISTDKAVRPTNIMGATKRLAEMVLQALAEVNAAVAAQGGRAPSAKTTFSMVRFGNVLGSSGSVVPLFREQIKNGGPITLTHADITRYFMTIPEAAQLVIQAGAMGQGGDVFVLDMGQPVKIMDLARRMVELSGLTVRDELNPSGDIELTVTGLRPGEKLYEELLIGDDPKPTQHPRIMKAHEQYLTWPQLEGKLNALSMAMSVNDVPVIRALLKDIVSGYQPRGEVVDWVHMALEREALANE